MNFTLLPRALLVIVASAVLAACGGDGGSGQETGTLKLSITDAAIDSTDAVFVKFTGVELKPRGGPAFSVDFTVPPIDLLLYQGTNSVALLDGQKVPAGEYEWMRLKVQADPNDDGDSYIDINGSICELRIPSGDETGLKLIRPFTVGVGAITALTIDFDLRKSIVQPPGQTTQVATCGGEVYLLKPVLRLIDDLQVGTITGTVDSTLVTQQCTAASDEAEVSPGNVYLFGPYTTAPVPGDPDDVDGTDATDGPLDWAKVALDGSSNYRYTFGFVPQGEYVLAYTCSPDRPEYDADEADEPVGADEVVTFAPSTGITATVTANQTTTVPEITTP